MASFAYVGSVNPNLICCICRAPFIDPVTSRTCSHTFCLECISRALSHTPHCPVDRLQLGIHDMIPAGPIVRSLVEELPVECSNSSSGCDHICQRQLLDTHVKSSCLFALMSCPQNECDEKVLRKDLDRHSSVCARRGEECGDCGVRIKSDNLLDHSKECPSQITSCPSCSIELRRSELDEHNRVCPDQTIVCNHSSNGCAWTGLRSSLPGHLSSCAYESIRGFFDIHHRTVQSLTEENSMLHRKVNALEGLVRNFRRDLSAVKDVLGPWLRLDGPSSIAPHQANLSEDGTSLDDRIGSWPNVSDFPMNLPAILRSEQGGSPSTHQQSNQDIWAPFFPPEASSSSGVEDQRALSSNLNAVHQGLRMQIPSQRRTSLGILSPTLSEQPSYMFTSSDPPDSNPSRRNLLVAPVASLNLDTTLEGSLEDLRSSVVTLATNVDSLARRNEMSLTSESLRLNEELIALRSSVHGLRMQVHGIMVDRTAQMSAGRMHESDNGVGWLGSPPQSRLYTNNSGGGPHHNVSHSITKL